MNLISRLQTRFLSIAERLSFLGPTLARLTLGVVFIGTGWGKLHGLDKVTDFFTELGIPAPCSRRAPARGNRVGRIGATGLRKRTGGGPCPRARSRDFCSRAIAPTTGSAGDRT